MIILNAASDFSTCSLAWIDTVGNTTKPIPVYHQSSEAPPKEKDNVHLQKLRSFEGHFYLSRAASQTTSSPNREIGNETKIIAGSKGISSKVCRHRQPTGYPQGQ